MYHVIRRFRPFGEFAGFKLPGAAWFVRGMAPSRNHSMALSRLSESVSMGKQQGLSIENVRAVFHLLNDLRDLGVQPQIWKQHMLCGLCRLIGGQVGISVQTTDTGAVDMAKSVVTDVGWASEKERGNWINYCRRNDLSVDPSRAAIMRLMTVGEPFVRAREELCHNRHWYSSDHVQITRKESNVDSFIFSYRRLHDPQRHHWLYLLRPWNDRPFEARQHRIVRLFHDELGQILDHDALRATQGAR